MSAVVAVAPIPVHVVGDETNMQHAPEFASWKTFVLQTGAEQPQQILPQAPNRARAHIRINPGFLDNNQQGFVRVGQPNQIRNAVPTGSTALNGMVMVAGQDLDVTSSGEVWLVGDGAHALTVVVLDERYAGPTDNAPVITAGQQYPDDFGDYEDYPG